MKSLTLRRWQFTGMLWIPKVDTNDAQGRSQLFYEKDIAFDFTGDPNAPRSVVVSSEPLPTTAVITRLRNRYLEEILPLAEWTVTSTEPILNMFGRVEAYRHQVALSNRPDFGYEVAR